MQASELIENDPEGHPHTRAVADWQEGEALYPTQDRVFIQRHAPEQTYGDTSIEIPDQHQSKEPICTVIAVGPKVTEISKGETVVVNTWAGEPIHHDELPRLYVITEGDIEAVLD